MNRCTLEFDYRCPIKLNVLSDFSVSAVNAIAIVTGTKWEDIVRSLMEIAKERACMPQYSTCVTDLLRMYGFATERCKMSVGDFMKICENSETTDKYIIKIDHYSCFAVVPSGNNKEYSLRGIRPLRYDLTNCKVEVLWKYYPGTDNRTGIKRNGFQMRHIAKEHKDLTVVNMNPQDHSVGDCSVRALCAAIECSWNEAIDLLASANRYTDPIINSVDNINNALLKLDFERHKTIKQNNKMLTGKAFAQLMTHTYHNGERIFAYVGNTHCAAFLPIEEADGGVRYKVQDTWDSTDKKIEDYWVIPPKKTRDRQKREQSQKALSNIASEKTELSVGDSITHNVFGTGVVESINEKFIEVNFSDVGIKKISKDWMKNCYKNQ